MHTADEESVAPNSPPHARDLAAAAREEDEPVRVQA
jgi:hypothetical protein